MSKNTPGTTDNWLDTVSNGHNLYVVQGYLHVWRDMGGAKYNDQEQAEICLLQYFRGMNPNPLKITDFRIVFRTVQEVIVKPSILQRLIQRQ